MTNRPLSKLKDKVSYRITRELNKKLLIHFYTIYTKESWFVLAINSPILKYIYCLCVICKSTHLEIHSHGEVTSKSYKPTFHSGHLSRNISYGGAAIIRVFHLPWRGYFSSTWSFMTELLLLVS